MSKYLQILVLVGGLACLPALGQGVVLDTIEMPWGPGFYALTGATVHTGGGATLSNATVVIRDGLIQSVQSGGAAPDGSRVIDLSGMQIYPGLIDALSHQGLSGQEARGQGQQRGRPGQGGGNPPEPTGEGPGLFTHVRASDILLPDAASKLKSWRESGVLVLNVAPRRGIFTGQSAVVGVSDAEPDEMIIRSPVAMNMTYQGMGRAYPGSVMGVYAHIKQTLLDAQHYDQARRTYEENPQGLKRPQTDRALEALVPYLNGDRPIIFPGERVRQIRRVLKMKAEFGFRPMIAGGFEADQAAAELKEQDVPVLFSLDFPKKPKDQHPEKVEGLAALEFRVNAPSVPGKLHSAGVRFAFASGGSRKASDFLAGLRKVSESGLGPENTLRAATLSAAEILGVERQLGSVESGKIANLLVADGDLFDSKTQIRHVFVDGQKYDYPAKKAKSKSGDTTDAVLAGTWDVQVTTPDAVQEMQFELTTSGDDIEGAVISQMFGSLTIFDGSLDGAEFSFKILLDLGEGPANVTFSGSIDGDFISGTADVEGLGAAPMEATRVPQF